MQVAKTYIIGSCVFADLDYPEMIEQVQRGIALLDRDRPAGWEAAIYLPDLDINSGCTCVLGQVYRDVYETGFVSAVEHLFGIRWSRNVSDSDYQQLVDHGFAVSLDLYKDLEPPKLQLEMVWSVFIKQRMEVVSHA
jgi:hypothetical protein